MPYAQTGLFTKADLKRGQQIFRADPLVAAVGDGLHRLVCDSCYDTRIRRVQSNNTICFDVESLQGQYLPCTTCNLCYYCDEV
jgi:hypothetical protein